MKAIGYIRVSTARQANEGVSLDAQKLKIEQYAALHDIELMEVVIDAGESAKTLGRQGIQKVLASVKAGSADAVVFLKLDRLTRSIRDLGAIVDLFNAKGAALISIQDGIDTSTAAGRLVLNVLGSVAQWEREAIGERTADALAHKRNLNEYTGGCVPFGKQIAADGIHLEDNTDAQKALEAIAELKGRGYSTRAIATELEARGIQNGKGGKSWSHVVVAKLAKRLAA